MAEQSKLCDGTTHLQNHLSTNTAFALDISSLDIVTY